MPERIYAAELNCRLTGPVVDFQAAFFAAMTLDGIETRTYYDDMASVYCDMAVTGVGRMSCGAEAAADIRLSYRGPLRPDATNTFAIRASRCSPTWITRPSTCRP